MTEDRWQGVKLPTPAYEMLEELQKIMQLRGTSSLPEYIREKLPTFSLGNILATAIYLLRLYLLGKFVEVKPQ